MQYRLKLQELAKKNGRPFRIALVGAGQMGRGFAAQAHRLGLEVAAVADIAPDRINQAFHDLGHPQPIISSDPAELNHLIKAGQPAGTTNADIVPQLDVDVVVEATGVAAIGADIIYKSLSASKHVATLNVEADVTVGPILHKTAKDHGVLYSVCNGD